jgi:hypothetical protein
MVIQQNNDVDKHSEVTQQKMNDKSDNIQMLSKKWIGVKSFYNKHFPTDRRSYNMRVPFVGLVVSVLSMHFVISELGDHWYFKDEKNLILLYLYVFVSAALSYELYYGLKIEDRKQHTPWILLKFIEICLTVPSIIFCVVRHGIDAIVYGSVVLILNALTTYIVGSTSLKQLREHPAQENVDDNIYDKGDNVDDV